MQSTNKNGDNNQLLDEQNQWLNNHIHLSESLEINAQRTILQMLIRWIMVSVTMLAFANDLKQ